MNSDICPDKGLLRLLPAKLHPWALLMRLDRPIGTWLLLLPCWWSITAATAPFSGGETISSGRWLALILLFSLGAVVMRGAGCTVNDMLDRDIDARVARTASRPLACGALTMRQATIFLGLQLLVGLAVLVQLNKETIVLGCCALLLAGVYPMMKRLTWWPQAWLGLTFNWGAILGWVAVRGTIDWPPVLIYIAGIFWTLGYDTIYAHQDKEDDMLVGVKSSALRLGDNTRKALCVFYGLTVLFLLLAGLTLHLGLAFYLVMVLVAAHLAWQVRSLNIWSPSDCLALFRANRLTGLLVALAFFAGIPG